MTTEVVVEKARLRRPYNFDTFRDIVPDETPRLPKRNNGDLAVTFDADLTTEQVDAIRLRLTTTSDADAVQVVALSQAADTARAWEVPPVLAPPDQPAPTPMMARSFSSAAITEAGADGTTDDAERDAALADLAAQVEWLTRQLATLTDYVLQRPPT